MSSIEAELGMHRSVVMPMCTILAVSGTFMQKKRVAYGEAIVVKGEL